MKVLRIQNIHDGKGLFYRDPEDPLEVRNICRTLERSKLMDEDERPSHMPRIGEEVPLIEEVLYIHPKGTWLFGIPSLRQVPTWTGPQPLRAALQDVGYRLHVYLAHESYVLRAETQLLFLAAMATLHSIWPLPRKALP